MVNPFTIQGKINKIQQEVLLPLYTMHEGQEQANHDWLLVETGRVIQKHIPFIEELCLSRLVAVVFKVVKLLGGADRLTEGDFDSFIAYVRDGGLLAMVKMLLAPEKEKVFLNELRRLPYDTRRNAPKMLLKSSELHKDFIQGFFKETYGDTQNAPLKLQENYTRSSDFINRLAEIAGEAIKKA